MTNSGDRAGLPETGNGTPQRSGTPSGSGLMKPDQAYRTGRLAHLKRDAFARVFNVPVAAEQPCVFVELGVIEQLQAMVPATD